MSRATRGRALARRGTVVGACLLAALLLGPTESLAQMAAPEFVIRSWDARDGLPIGAITDIERTRNGYLWLATKKGLVRFDGARFKLFDSQNTPQFRTNLVTSLQTDPQGRLWVGTPNGLFQ